MKKSDKMLPVPEVGKFYHFWDDGKTGPSRHYICKVEELIIPEQAKEIILEENCLIANVTLNQCHYFEREMNNLTNRGVYHL